MIFTSIFGKKKKSDDQDLESPENIFSHKNSSFEDDNNLNNYDTLGDLEDEDGEITDTNEPFLDLSTMEKDEIEELDSIGQNKNQDDSEKIINVDILEEKKEPRSIKINKDAFLTEYENNKNEDDNDDLFLNDNTESDVESLDTNENLSVQMEVKDKTLQDIENNELNYNSYLTKNNNTEGYSEENNISQDTISSLQSSINIEEDPLYENNIQNTDANNIETIAIDNNENDIADLLQTQETISTEEDLKFNESTNNNEIIENEELSKIIETSELVDQNKIAEIPNLMEVEKSYKNEQAASINDNSYDFNQNLDASTNNLEVDKTANKEINIDELFDEKLNSLLSNVSDEITTSNIELPKLNEIKNGDETHNNLLKSQNISEEENLSMEIDNYLKTKTDSEKIVNDDINQESANNTSDIKQENTINTSDINDFNSDDNNVTDFDKNIVQENTNDTMDIDVAINNITDIGVATNNATDIDAVDFDKNVLDLQENSTTSENKEIYDTIIENVNDDERIDSNKFEDFGSELMNISETNNASLKDDPNIEQDENNDFELNNKEIEAEDMGIENNGIVSDDDSGEDIKLQNKESSEDKNQNIDIPDININELEQINDDFLSEIQAEKAKEIEEEKKKIKLETGDDEKEEEMELKPLEVDESLTDIIGLCADNIEEYLKSNGKSICAVEDKEQKEVKNDKKLEETKNENNSKNISFNALDGFHINEELWSELKLSNETMEKIENRVKIEIKSFFVYNLIPILKDIIK